MKVAVAAGGRFHSLRLAHQLLQRSYLGKLYTCSYTEKDNIPRSFVENNKSLFLLDEVYIRGFLNMFNPSSLYVFKDNLFDMWLKSKMKDSDRLDIFVGWAHYWLKGLPEIRRTGAKIILESGSRHILDQTSLLEEEFKQFGVEINPVHPKNIAKILAEYNAADYIMTPSKNVYDSFLKKGVSKEKLLKVPYGVDIDKFYHRKSYRDDLFRVIFVGSVGLQKGIQYLLKAWNKLDFPINKTELLIVGGVENSFKDILKRLKVKENVKFAGPLTHDVLVDEYKRSTVFVLPSIQDGLAMVQAEAMASGLPVICTTNTGGAELIENGVEGFIVPIRDVDSLVEKISWCYENREECFNMGLLAQKKVQAFTWDHYGTNVVEIYKGILSQ